MPRRLDQHGVQDHDAGHPEQVEDIDHAVAVGSVVDAVLVLHHHHVEGVQGRGRSVPPRRVGRAPCDARPSARRRRAGRSSTRTTPVSWPAAAISAWSAAVNVASPHWVGGKLLRNPNDADMPTTSRLGRSSQRRLLLPRRPKNRRASMATQPRRRHADQKVGASNIRPLRRRVPDRHDGIERNGTSAEEDLTSSGYQPAVGANRPAAWSTRPRSVGRRLLSRRAAASSRTAKWPSARAVIPTASQPSAPSWLSLVTEADPPCAALAGSKSGRATIRYSHLVTARSQRLSRARTPLPRQSRPGAAGRSTGASTRLALRPEEGVVTRRAQPPVGMGGVRQRRIAWEGAAASSAAARLG